MYEIKNNKISVRVSETGAELKSIYSRVTDMEYLWQPGYETWPHSSMLLFPNPGRIARGRTVIGGKVYPANMHGFAWDMPFALAEHGDDRLVLELRDNEHTRKYYPYAFCLRVEFTLNDDMLVQSFHVVNEDDKPMYYCLGAHPGFYCPLVPDEKAEDYSLEFDRPQRLNRQELEESTRLLTGNSTVCLNGERHIPLHEHFFDGGPKLFSGMNAKTLTLRSAVSGRFAELGVEDFTDLCLWGVPGRMSLIAVEPWIGTSDRADTDHIWEHKPGIRCVGQRKTNVHTLTFRVG